MKREIDVSLCVSDLNVSFGGVLAVDGVTFEVGRRSVHGLIGPNGAGKTTVFNLISGLIAPSSGEIILDGVSLTGLPSFERTRQGLARTFQNIRTFRGMSLLENVMTGAHACLPYSFFDVIFRRSPFGRAEEEAIDCAYELLRFVGLHDQFDRCAGELSYGDQRKLEIARALATKPKLLLLDEPAAGLNPSETVALGEIIARLREKQITVLVVEHDMQFIMNLCDEITVLNFGKKISAGRPEEVRADAVVREAYLGVESEVV